MYHHQHYPPQPPPPLRVVPPHLPPPINSYNMTPINMSQPPSSLPSPADELSREVDHSDEPTPHPVTTIFDGKIWALDVVQQPIRARMCGFGDKDRRPITPPPCIRLIIMDELTKKEVDINTIDTTFFVLTVDLWNWEATKEVNLVKSSQSNSPAISTVVPASYPYSHSSTPSNQPTPRMVKYTEVPAYANSTHFDTSPVSTQQLIPASSPMPSAGSAYTNGVAPTHAVQQSPQYPYQDTRNGSVGQVSNSYQHSHHSSSYSSQNASVPISPYQSQQNGGYPSQNNSYPAPQNAGYPSSQNNGYPAPQIGGYQHSQNNSYQPQQNGSYQSSQSNGYQSQQNAAPSNTTNGSYTRNLIGSLSASAFKLNDPEDRIGVWFILQDLSVRTEGWFRLKMNFVNVGQAASPDPTSPASGASGQVQQMVTRTTAPVLASIFSKPFQVFSAKKFPGVIESTELSKIFAAQGIKIPIRKDPVMDRKRKGGPNEEDEDDDFGGD